MAIRGLWVGRNWVLSSGDSEQDSPGHDDAPARLASNDSIRKFGYHGAMGDVFKEFFGIFSLVLPFLFVGALARELAQEREDVRFGWGLFLVGSLVLVLNGLWGYLGYQSAIAEHRWTAASFSLVAIVVRSVPIVLVCWAVRGRLGRRGDDDSE